MSGQTPATSPGMASRVKRWLAQAVRGAKRSLSGATRRFCPVCENWADEFASFGVVPRRDALCPTCGSLERHRFLWLFLTNRTDLFDGQPKRMLHVAPEPCLAQRFRERLGDNYLTADLFDERAMVKMDITDIQYPDESFDVIYCSHVLEHVPDDRRAMREFCRTLTKNGWAILNVPVNAPRTFEDPTVVDPQERLRLFGQTDHVRKYGPDYIDRLHEAGFQAKVIRVGDLTDERRAKELGLTEASGEIYFCSRQDAASGPSA